MSSSNQDTIIQYLIDTVIEGYMLSDLRRIIALPVIPNQVGNCNFPIVLYIFACMEFLGTLVSEKPIPDRPGSTQERVWAYMELTVESFKDFEKYKDSFIQIFRHGLSHEFFAKNAGISRHQSDIFGTSPGGKLVLDADRFYDVFQDSCFKLKSMVNTDQELTERISVRYLKLQQRNREQWSVNTPAVFVSGTTGSRQFTSDQALATPSLPPNDDD